MAPQQQQSPSPFVVSQTHHTESQMMVRSGPLPPPEDFSAYNQGHPDAAGRILTMAEQQASHRRDLEKMVIAANIAREARGQNYAAGAFAVVALGGFVLMNLGHQWSGALVLFGDLASIVTVFLTGRAVQTRELEKKAPPAQG